MNNADNRTTDRRAVSRRQYQVVFPNPCGPLTVTRTNDRERAKGCARAVRGFVRDTVTGQVFCPPINAWMVEEALEEPGMRRLIDAVLGDARDSVCCCEHDYICPRCARARGLA
ncbi:MAG: hypothetical protein KF884_10805 [Fimbriimonadaceae bacterium]|nr:hypothetical protein [Fimbriimonadaceae bacterium]QYK58036.1 MAG: hypothetical protein KF884_10805 [Fimbriimonadaceae bacterium]